MWSSIQQQEWVAMESPKIPTPQEDGIIHAVVEDDIKELNSALSSIPAKERSRTLNSIVINERPLLHHITFTGKTSLLTSLLNNGINTALSNRQGRTALHEAISADQMEAMEILLRDKATCDETDGLSTVELAYDSVAALATTGTLVNLEDHAGLTPILLLAETATLSTQRFTTMLGLLIRSGANIRKLHPGTGQNILFRAVELDATAACESLIQAGISIEHQDFFGNTVLHLAAKLDKPEILNILLQQSKKSINTKNREGESPLHCAAVSGSRACINTLLGFGGNLSLQNIECETVVDAIFSNLSRPTTFIEEILNSKVIPNQCSINGQQFEMTIDFRILTPNKEDQMSVVIALINTMRNLTQKHLLQHPLIEAYLRFKWTRLRIFFFALVIFHLVFVLSLSCHAILILNPTDVDGIMMSRRALFAAATLLLGHLILQVLLAPRYFLSEAETWLSMGCVTLAFIMSLTGEILPAPEETVEWVRHVASFTVLLSWVQIMFILGRFPTVGFFALMFFTVFKNMLKVLLIFACLVIGFSLSFCIQFNDFEYEGPWRSFLRTVVMLMGEYDYQTMFKGEPSSSIVTRWENKPSHLFITSQIIFLLFILLGSVVLMNLMIGLAVSDIQELQAVGNLRHMIKQAEFLHHMDRILSFSKLLAGRKTIPSIVTVNPSTKKKIRESQIGKHLPSHVIEGLVKIALKNQRRESDGSTTEGSILATNKLKECQCEIKT